MEQNKEYNFKLKSTNNEYNLKLGIFTENNSKKLKIYLKHILTDKRPLEFSMQKEKDELIKENEFFNEFESVEQILEYLKDLIYSGLITIIKDSQVYYNLNFFDRNKNKYFQILLLNREPNGIDLETEIEKLKQSINNKTILMDILSTFDIKPDKGEKAGDINNINNTISSLPSSNSGGNGNKIDDDDIPGNILKENNNNISFNKNIFNLEKEKILSDEKEECENFTAFNLKNGKSMIVWSLKTKGDIILYSLEERQKNIYKDAHTNNINSIQYFHDHNAHKEYIISLSKSDDDVLKFWEINDEKISLEHKKSFNKIFLERNVEIFCTFNYSEFNNSESYIFLWGESIYEQNIYDINIEKKIGIAIFQINEDLNQIAWDENNKNKDKNEEKQYFKIINNINKIKNLDTFYDFTTKELYLINCNESLIEVIKNPLSKYSASVFKYKDWNFHCNAFIKKINDELKLIEANINGIIIWDIKTKKPELIYSLENFCPFDIISLNRHNIFVSGNDAFLILKINEGNIELKLKINKVKGYTKVRKITTPEANECVVAIDNHQIKYWVFK